MVRFYVKVKCREVAWRRARRRIKVWYTDGVRRPYFLVEYTRFGKVNGVEWCYQSRAGFLLYKTRLFGVLGAARYLVDKTRAAVLRRMEEDGCSST